MKQADWITSTGFFKRTNDAGVAVLLLRKEGLGMAVLLPDGKWDPADRFFFRVFEDSDFAEVDRAEAQQLFDRLAYDRPQ